MKKKKFTRKAGAVFALALLLCTVMLCSPCNAAEVGYEYVATCDGNVANVNLTDYYHIQIEVSSGERPVYIEDISGEVFEWLPEGMRENRIFNFYGTTADIFYEMTGRVYYFSETEIDNNGWAFKFNGAENVVATVYKRNMSESVGLLETMFGSFGETISGIGNGIKDMFSEIIFENDGSISSFAKFGFLMMGVTMACGLGYVIIRKIRG